MDLIWQKYAVVLILFRLIGQSFTWDPECPLPVEAIEPVTFIKTKWDQEDLRQTWQIRDLEVETVGKGNIDTLVRALSLENIMRHLNGTPDEIKMLGDISAGDSRVQDITFPNFFQTCPHSWFLIRRAEFYWRIWKWYRGYISIHYCFTYWWLWATYCPFCYCSLQYYPFHLGWDPRYRCFPEYRVIWLPMVCYHIKIYPNYVTTYWQTWRWRRVFVPRGCCCRKFWPWLKKNDQCLAISSTKAAVADDVADAASSDPPAADANE